MLRTLLRPLWLAPLVLAATAQSQVVSYSTAYQSPTLAQPWLSTLTLPRFDPSLGHLATLVLNLDGRLGGLSRMENVSASPIYAQATTTVLLTLSMPAPVLPVAVAPSMIDGQADLPEFDTVLDFAGTSGFSRPFVSQPGGSGSDYHQRVLVNPADLAVFFGPAGAPGTLTFNVQASQNSNNQTGPSLAADPLAAISGTFRIDYVYEPLPGPVCTSVASWGGCPCSNQSAPTNGCANSVFPAGAGLTRSGAASIANDTLAFSATNMSGSSALFVQSSALLDPGAFFGDGLRCLAGATIRLGSNPIAAGASSYPQAGQLSISVRGGVMAPGMLYYQAYYRNTAGFCTPATFNLSSGQAVLWQL